jgi:predicted O-methyltransferase YrrM
LSGTFEDFLFVENDWMRKEFGHLELVQSTKYFTLKVALNIFLQSNGKLIVETGTQRVIDDRGGCSTLLFAAFCERYKRALITVDNDLVHMAVSKLATEKYRDYVTYVLQDSVEFLSDFDKPIDLLYLDSLDCPMPPEDATEAQRHNAHEFLAALHCLHTNSLLIIDDNNFENGGKSRLTKEVLLKTKGWVCLLDDGQSLWMERE